METKEAFVVQPLSMFPQPLIFRLLLIPPNSKAVVVGGNDKDNLKQRVAELIDEWWPKTE